MADIGKFPLNMRSRAAIFRILSDLVKSDNVISLSELNTLERYFCDFQIRDEDKRHGFGMTLQEAFDEIIDCRVKIKKDIEKAMIDISCADNECSGSEAMLITAFRYAVMAKGATMYSMRFRNRPILDTQILYIENAAASGRRIGGDLLRDCHEQVSAIVEAAGFDLVYIPEIKKRLNSWDSIRGKGNLERVFGLIAPTMAKDEIVTIVESAKGLTTKKFYEDVLCSQDGLSMPLAITKPSWMVRLSNSTLNGEEYANFICMELEFDKDSREERDAQICQQMTKFVRDLNSLRGTYSILVNQRKTLGEDFQYGGFYKVLFDVLLGKKSGSWSLHICPGIAPKEYYDGSTYKRSQLYIQDEGKRLWIPLTGMDAALYTLIILMSIEGREGLDVRFLSKTQRLFKSVYLEITTRDTCKVPDVTAPSTLRQVKFRIRKALDAVTAAFSHNLLLDQDGSVLKVRIDPSNVIVGPDTPLMSSSLYKTFRQALRHGSFI